MKSNLKVLTLLAVVALPSILASCGRHEVKESGPSPDEIVADATLRPLIDSEVIAFEGLQAENNILDSFEVEENVFKALLSDSVRFIIAARPMNAAEKKFFDEKSLITNEVKIATDAIAIIANNELTESRISWQKLTDICTGKVSQWKDLYPSLDWGPIQVVFDHPHSSIVQYMQDSVMKSTQRPASFFALQSPAEVIAHVEKNKNAIGLIGVSWISDRDDSSAGSFLSRVKTMLVQNPRDQEFYEPFQAYMATREYPLTRDIYIITRGNRARFPFANYIANEKGQRVVLKMGLVPATMPVRLVKIKKSEDEE